MTRYLKITQTDGVRYILRVTRETPAVVIGIEVDAEGEEIVPRGIHPKIGEPYHQRERKVMRDAIKKAVEMRMNPKYATLEVVPRQEITEKPAHSTIATNAACTVTRSKLYPTPGRSYRVAWKWIYTVAIPGEPYTFDGDTLSWVRSLCKRKAPELPIVYAWKEPAAHAKKKTSAQLDAEIAHALAKPPSRAWETAQDRADAALLAMAAKLRRIPQDLMMTEPVAKELYGHSTWVLNQRKARKYLESVAPKWGIRTSDVSGAAWTQAIGLLDDRARQIYNR
jgi:hypothetical protein